MNDHYFTARPEGPRRPRTVRFRMDGTDVELTSDASVFSADRLDPGTRVVLTETPPPRPGVLVDLGCGYGAIACVQAMRQPGAEVWAVDVNERARELTAANAAALGVSSRVHVAAPEDVPVDVRADEIWSNPPIRIGKPALHEMLTRWLGRLAPDGTAWLVVAKNLGSDSLQRWLTEQGFDAHRHTSVRGYRVLRVRPPGGARHHPPPAARPG
jgi:16S rRNA (guanine1207-N2)-methyltransferase